VGLYVSHETLWIGASDPILKYAKSIRSREKLVEEGFNSLGNSFSFLVYIIKGIKLTECEQNLSKRNLAHLLDFARNNILFPVPTLPEEEILFRLSSFGKARNVQSDTF
jgi:hypothetical protein